MALSRMSTVGYAFTAACTGCGACLLTCPQQAIRPGVDARLTVLAGRCDGCAECIEVCPADAIREYDSWEYDRCEYDNCDYERVQL